MRSSALTAAALGFLLFAEPLPAQRGTDATQAQANPPAPDPIAVVVGRLDLEKYKATIKGLTEFGDRRQGTDRNRAAIDWIEAQLKSYGCPTERLKYTYPPPPAPGRGNTQTGQAGQAGRAGQAGQTAQTGQAGRAGPAGQAGQTAQAGRGRRRRRLPLPPRREAQVQAAQGTAGFAPRPA